MKFERVKKTQTEGEEKKGYKEERRERDKR